MRKELEHQLGFCLYIGAASLILLFFLEESVVFLEWFFASFLMLIASIFLIKPVINHITRKHKFGEYDAIFVFVGVFSWLSYVFIAGQTLYDSVVLFLEQLFIASVFVTILQWMTSRESGK
jgi:hypothetical protein